MKYRLNRIIRTTRILMLFLFSISSTLIAQSDSIKQKRDVFAIHVNVFKPLSAGIEIFPEKHHGFGLETQIWSPKHLKMGTDGRGVVRVFMDYRYYFSKLSGSSGFFIGTYLMYKQQHSVAYFSSPFYHGVQYEGTAKGMWGGGMLGFRIRFPVKLFLSFYLGVAGPISMEYQVRDYTPSTILNASPYPKSHFARDIRAGGEIGILF